MGLRAVAFWHFFISNNAVDKAAAGGDGVARNGCEAGIGLPVETTHGETALGRVAKRVALKVISAKVAMAGSTLRYWREPTLKKPINSPEYRLAYHFVPRQCGSAIVCSKLLYTS